MKKNNILFYMSFWVIASLFGALPYLFFGATHSFTDALFESVSGFTTTGTSVLSYSAENQGLFFWRAATQWLGGISFIVLSLVIFFPLQKLHPRRKTTIIWLCFIYFLLTAAETISLYVAGMSIFDAVSYSFSTISTGGFYANAIENQPAIQYILTAFMFLAGVNYTLYIRNLLSFKNLTSVKDEEFRFYAAFVLIFSVIVALTLFFSANMNVADSLRTSLFRVTGVISTTGFYADGATSQIPLLQLLFIILFLFGASSGSAGGGVKIKRIALILKNLHNSFRHFIHPNALSTTHFDGKPATLTTVNTASLYFILYIFVALTGILLLVAINIPLRDATNLALTSLANIGSDIPALPLAGKYILMLLMIIGRLELFALFVVFSRGFWKK